MIYKDLLIASENAQKALSGCVNESKKNCGAIAKALDNGDLRALDKRIQEMEEILKKSEESLKALKAGVSSFDRSEYVLSGDYRKEIVGELEKQAIDVKDGEGMVLEVFPNKISINGETQEITIDKKRLYCLNPEIIVDTVKKTQDKMASASFNAERFIKELSSAYEQYISIESVKKNKKPVRNYVKLSEIYKMLAPTARAKKDYDIQSYAFDLARLFNMGTVITKDGYELDWDTSRNLDKSAIRILDGNGNENYLKSLRFQQSEY